MPASFCKRVRLRVRVWVRVRVSLGVRVRVTPILPHVALNENAAQMLYVLHFLPVAQHAAWLPAMFLPSLGHLVPPTTTYISISVKGKGQAPS